MGGFIPPPWPYLSTPDHLYRDSSMNPPQSKGGALKLLSHLGKNMQVLGCIEICVANYRVFCISLHAAVILAFLHLKCLCFTTVIFI